MEAQALYALMSARRSCRAYTGEQVPAELLAQVLEAGRMAPSGRNVQLCHFIALQNQQRLQELRGLVTEVFAGMAEGGGNVSVENSIKAAQKGAYDFFYGAPTLIVVANRPDNPNHIADSAVALQNMMLMATALGLGNCWINQLRWLNESPQLRRFLGGLGLKDDERVYGSLALGYAQNALGAALPRRVTADIVE